MRSYPYVTVDVFTAERFGGNPLAVVLDARGLSDAEMQQLAAEFNYSETTFVLPPERPGHTARVRIFNRVNEMPFAGHPNVGTAIVLGWLRNGLDDQLVFEEKAGLVPVTLSRGGDGMVKGALINAPEALSTGIALPVETVAACLRLTPAEIRTGVHPPLVASVGMPFVHVEVAPETLSRTAPDPARWRETLERWNEPLGGELAVFHYAHDGAGRLRARMFAPEAGMWEDAATGSASAALAALLLSKSDAKELSLDISQGTEMGRPSRIAARSWRADDGIRASVEGGAVMVFRGEALL